VKNKLFSIQDIVEISLLCGIAIVLDRFVKIPFAPTGGSINLSAIPLILICLRHGPIKGLIACGVIFGFITCILDDYGLNTYPFEYFIGFGSIAIVGLFAKLIHKSFNEKNKKIISFILVFISLTLWAIIRVLFASFDSMIFYDYNFVDSMIYNVPYVFISYDFDLLITLVILYPIIKINHLKPSTYLKNI